MKHSLRAPDDPTPALQARPCERVKAAMQSSHEGRTAPSFSIPATASRTRRGRHGCSRMVSRCSGSAPTILGSSRSHVCRSHIHLRMAVKVPSPAQKCHSEWRCSERTEEQKRRSISQTQKPERSAGKAHRSLVSGAKQRFCACV